MKKNYVLIPLLVLFCTSLMFGQVEQRYTHEVFTDAEIKASLDIKFATNATLLPILFQGATEFLPEDLFMDVYEPDPATDTARSRPVVLVVHGGDALPRIANNACWGDKQDSVTIVTARKLARMGYVAVAPNYRLGWNPLATTQDAFLDGLVDASVRIQQDLKACARFLRMDEAELGNTYGIAPDKIAIWGTASSAGTYSGFAAYINDIEETQTPTWFVTDEDGNISNTYDAEQAGNLDGTVVGTLPNGDTTNYVNWPDYSSRFQLAVLGSAISLDSGSLDLGEPPLIQMGNPNSVVTAVPEGPIQLPTTGEVVAFVQLSQGMIQEAVNKGLNDAWINAGLSDPYTQAQQAQPRFGAWEGWLPLHGDPENEYPWVWWDTLNCPVSMQSFDVLPNADRNLGLLQIDTMTAYFGVRACITLDLGCDLSGVSPVKDIVLEDNLVKMAPNPTRGFLTVESTDAGRMIEDISIVAIDGRIMQRYRVQNDRFQKDDLQLAAGLYTVIVRFEDGIVPKKLLVH